MHTFKIQLLGKKRKSINSNAHNENRKMVVVESRVIFRGSRTEVIKFPSKHIENFRKLLHNKK